MVGARKGPISVNGAFPLLNGPFSLLNGPFPRKPWWAVVPLENPLEKSPLRKGAILVTRVAATSDRKSLAIAIADQKNHCDSENKKKTSNTSI